MIILDCSAALRLMRQPGSDETLEGEVRQTDVIMAPQLLRYELASAYRKYIKAGVLTEQEALLEIADAIALIDIFAAADDYLAEALHESIRCDHSPYDMFYLLLARRNAATLATCDKALGRICDDWGVRSIGWR